MSEHEPDDTETALGPQLEAAWPAALPPAGFADRVVSRQAPRTWRRSAALALPLLALAAGALLWLRKDDASGSAAPLQRTTLAIGRRATAVAEAGATLSFTVRGGEARVQQSQGEVFYRVDPGGAFVVKTPLGEVHVKGTCFRVEVVPMNIKQSLIGAALGATTASAVAVTVYEGRVEVQSARGAVSLGPGETLRSEDPAVTAKPAGAPEARDRAQRQEIARLQARVAELERPRQGQGAQTVFENVIEVGDKTGRRPPVGDVAPDMPKKFLDFTRDEWASMATRCELRMQLPPFALGGETHPLDAREARELGFSEDDRRRYNDLLNNASDEHRTALAAIYKDITGDAGERLTIGALEAEIRAKSLPGDFAAARRRYAEERAGVATAETARATPMDRYVRLQGGAWEDFEGKLAALVGADKARATRDRPAARLKVAGCQ